MISSIYYDGHQRAHFLDHPHDQLMELDIRIELIADISVDDHTIRLSLLDHPNHTSCYRLVSLFDCRESDGSPVGHMQEPEFLISLH